MAKIKVPRCMSTQHPDNVNTPFFSDNEVIGGETEVKEAFYVFSQLGCKEQMWDSEGKEVDNEVVEKLISNYTEYFKRNILGKDVFLTYRVPNPSVQKEQGKALLETLHSILRAFDVSNVIDRETAPIFEVILPMTTSSRELVRIKNYYNKILIGQKNLKLGKDDITVKQWIGDFEPETINVIPLFEEFNALMSADRIVEEYLKQTREKDQEYQRVFLARSDPALNYGSLSAVLLAKVTLQKLSALEEKTSIDLLPILGVGGAPFRGNFTPENINNCGDEYPSVQTFTVQSSFKYDYPARDVINAIDMINFAKRGRAREIDEKEALKYYKKVEGSYQKQISSIADVINKVALYVPSKRRRKLHIGLFGYSRSMKGIMFPRAIKFCAAFYSIGLPPELLGFNDITEQDFDKIREIYLKIDEDFKDSVKWLNKANLEYMPKEIRQSVAKITDLVGYEKDEDYCDITGRIYSQIRKGSDATLKEDIREAAMRRRFLG